MNPPNEQQVEIPAEGVEAAYRSLDGEQLKWLASAPPDRKGIALKALQAAAPSIRQQERERLEQLLLGEAEKLERPNEPGEDLTAATVRACKSQGIREALSTLKEEDH